MNFSHKFSLRLTLLILPTITFVLISATFGLFAYFGNSSLSQLQKIHSGQVEKSKFFINLGSDVAKNHIKIYQLMRSADDGADEGDFYDDAKPLLLEIHDIEASLKGYLSTYSIGSLVKIEIINFQKKLISYRINTTNAILMATVDSKLSQKLLRESTEYYIDLNNRILSISRTIQKKMNLVMIKNHENVKFNFIWISIIIILFITSLIFLSILVSRVFSKNFHEKIIILNSLLENSKLSLPVIRNQSEIDILSDVIDKVKNNFNALEDAHRTLGYQEYQVRAILNNMVDSVVTIDASGEILTFNNSAEKSFGYAMEDIVGKNVSLLIHKNYSSQHDFYLKSFLSENVESNIKSNIKIGIELDGLRQDKTCFPVYLSVSELPSPLNNNQCFICCYQDLSIIKQKEAQLQRSQKMDALGKLTGGIAHDYNNMLGVILGYAELLKDGLDGQEKLSNYISAVIKAGNRSAELTRRLLSFSKRKSTRVEMTNINTLLMNDKALLEKTLTANIKLTYNLMDDLWLVNVDCGDLLDAIINISINAMHAIDAQGEITFTTRNVILNETEAYALQIEKGHFVSLSISDTGCGIDKDALDKIFEPFYTTKGAEGTGLGLSQVYGFVKRSGVEIKVESAPGEGAQFTLYFPRYYEDTSRNNSVNISYKSNANNTKGTGTILVVDDEQALINLASEVLRKNGYQVISAKSAQQALNILESETVDLLFSDIIMPDMDGYQLASMVQNKYPAVKIQLVSGFSGDCPSTMLDSEFHKNLLTKPYKSQDLIQRIHELLI